MTATNILSYSTFRAQQRRQVIVEFELRNDFIDTNVSALGEVIDSGYCIDAVEFVPTGGSGPAQFAACRAFDLR